MSTPVVSTAANKADRKTRVYEVSSLDTLHSIALKFKMTTGELLRLNGLPSTYRIYSGQHLTVFENASSGAPEVTRATERPTIEFGEGNRSPTPTDQATASTLGANGATLTKPPGKHQRMPSTVDLEMSFTDVITPSYRSVPTLVLLRQIRDKKYFGDGKNTSTAHAGVSDTLTATMSKQSAPSFGPGLQHGIPEELRLSSRDLVKEHVRYYINEQRNVFGELTLMPSTIIFEPALDDPVTRQLGLMNCQFQCDLKDVLDVHVIEASEILGWWKQRSSPNASPASPPANPNNNNISSANGTSSSSSAPHGSLLHSSSMGQIVAPNGPPGQGSPSPSSNSNPSASTVPMHHQKRPRTHSMNHGPSSSHLNTGSSSPTTSSPPMLEDRAPRFLQLTVLMNKQAEGTQVGKIVYFLINRQSVDLFYQKLEVWCAQARPVTLTSRKQVPNNILKPQLGLYERHERDRAGSNSAAPMDPTLSVAPTSSTSSASPVAPALQSSPSQGDPKHTPPPQSNAATTTSADIPKLNLPSALLNDAALLRLSSALPSRYRFSDWTLLYSTERHGVSLMTFFNKTKRKGPSYLIIEDEAGFLFGAYISDSWEPQRSYYGTGECFLFTLYPSFNLYPWSQLNEYFIYSKEDTIALGGGSGKFALWLDKDLLQGSSAPCDTFLNSTLSYQEDFKPVIVEVWGFNDAMK